jgi:hypothetical protein
MVGDAIGGRITSAHVARSTAPQLLLIDIPPRTDEKNIQIAFFIIMNPIDDPMHPDPIRPKPCQLIR